MSVNATASFILFVKETLALGVDGVTNPVLDRQIGGSQNYSASTTPAVSEISYESYAMTAGARTLDLTTDLIGTGGTNVDLSTLRPRVVYMKNLGAADITITKGASNGCDMFGSSWTEILRPGEELFRKLSSTGPGAIGAANKTIDITGTGTDALDFGIIAG